jgi:hypothetical protein
MSGGRAYARQLGLDWKVFLDAGIPVSELQLTGNEFAIRLAAEALKDSHG